MLRPILCVGACAWTTIFRVAHLPRGSAKIIPDEAIQIGDGMSATAACAIVKLGGRAEFWARVGDDANGRAAIASLTRGEFSALLTEVRWPEGAAAALDVARAAGIPAILDAEVGAPGVLEDLAQRATHVLYSETGLAAHVGDVDVRTQLERAQVALPNALVGVTRGSEGFFWLENGHIHHAAGVSVTAVDTLGAGDVFHGAYALALTENMSKHDAARFACVAASLKCEVFGGRIGAPDRAAVTTYL